MTGYRRNPFDKAMERLQRRKELLYQTRNDNLEDQMYEQHSREVEDYRQKMEEDRNNKIYVNIDLSDY